MSNFMITTMDNEYNPFTQFKEWFARDRQLGYNTCQWLDKYTKTSAQLEDEMIEEDVITGANSFLSLNPFGMHYKVYEDEAEKIIPMMNEVYRSQIKDSMPD